MFTGKVIRASWLGAEGRLMSCSKLLIPGVERPIPGVSSGSGMVKFPEASHCPCPWDNRLLIMDGDSIEEGRMLCEERVNG